MSERVNIDQGAWEVAHRYYRDGQSMESIARELGISHSTVSRRLQYARDVGIVEIRLSPTPAGAVPIERRIAEKWRVRATVVTSEPGAGDETILEDVARAAGRTLVDGLPAQVVLGVAWGSTMEAVSRNLPTRAIPDATVVQLNGAGNFHTSGVPYASELLRRFGDALGARVEQFPVPAFFDSAATRNAMWQERTTRRILALHQRLDVAMFGIGSPFAEARSQVYQGGYLDRTDVELLRNERVVGDVATVFYRTDGSSSGIPLNDRASGPAFPVLRRARKRICVVTGARKEAALIGALEANLVTDLVLDRALAERLVRHR